MYCRSGHNHRGNVNRKTVKEKTLRWPKNWQLIVSSQVPSNKTLRRTLRRQTLLTVINCKFITLICRHEKAKLGSSRFIWNFRKKHLVDLRNHYRVTSTQTYYVTDLWHWCRILYFSVPKPEQYRNAADIASFRKAEV